MTNKFTASCIVSVVTLAGCGGIVSAAAPVHVRVSGVLSTTDPASALIIDQFNKSHPGIVAELDPSPPSMGQDLASMSKFFVQVIGGDPAAVANVDRFNVPAVAARHLLMDLTPFIKADNVNPGDWYPAVWDETKFKGGVYALPRSTDDRPLFYNKSMFSKFGLDPNHPPETWDELALYQQKLTSQDASGKLKTLGINPLWGQGWFYLWGWENGGHFVSEDLKHPTFNDPNIIGALQYLEGLYRDAGGIDAMKGVTKTISDGTLAMEFSTNGAIGGLVNAAAQDPSFKFGVAYPPVPAARLTGSGRFAGLNPRITWSGGWSDAIPVGVKDPQAAWEVVKWITSPEADEIRAAYWDTHQPEGAVWIPGMTGNSVADHAIFNKYLPDLKPGVQASENFILSLMNDSRFRPHSPLAPELWHAQDQMAQDVAKLQLTPQAAAAKWQTWLEGQFSDYYSHGELETTASK